MFKPNQATDFVQSAHLPLWTDALPARSLDVALDVLALALVQHGPLALLAARLPTLCNVLIG